MVYKAGDYGPANSIQNQDLGARVWLKLSNFYFWTFQDQEARHRWVTAVLRTALLVKTKLLRSVSLLTAQCIFFITVLPISQRNCVSVPTAVFEGFGCISSPPKGRPHAEQKSPKGAGSPPPQQLCCPAEEAALQQPQDWTSSLALQGSGPQWSLTVPIWAEDQGLLSQSGLICLFVCYSPRPLNLTRHKQSSEHRSKSRSHTHHASVLNQ